MNVEDSKNSSDKYKNIIREKLIIDNEEKENEENNFPKNFTFNLEYQKIINAQDGQPKISTELKKLIDFVKKRYFYKDIKGNRITPKGELLPTPFQKLKKINEEIKNYYDYKINRKNSPLIVQNYRNKNIHLNKKFNFFNTLSYTKKKKFKKYFSSQKNKDNFEKSKSNQIMNNYKPLNSQDIKNNFNIMSNIIINEHPNNKNDNDKINNRICLSDTFNRKNPKYFSNSKFNQINFWKIRMLYSKSISESNNRDNSHENKTNFNHYITEYNKSNKKNKLNNMFKTSKIEKSNNTLDKFHTSYTMNNINKKKDYSNNLNKYNLIQFNMNQLIKQDNKNKDKLIINMRRTQNNLNNRKIMINKTINVNIDNNNFSRTNQNFVLKHYDFKNQIKNSNIIKDIKFNNNQIYKSLKLHKPEMKIHF